MFEPLFTEVLSSLGCHNLKLLLRQLVSTLHQLKIILSDFAEKKQQEWFENQEY